MLKDLLRSSPFRITILYTLLFTVSSVVMLAFIYFGASREFKKTLQNQITTETDILQRDFHARGYDDLITMIQARSNAPATSFFLYAIADRSGHQTIGNLPTNRLHSGWSEITLKHNIVDPEDGGETLLMMFGSPLGDGNLLIIGAGLDQGHDLRQLIINSLVSSLAFILPMVLGGGLFLSRAVLARLTRIHRVSRKIMTGDLSRRLPIEGSNDEFDQLSESMNAMLDRIEELMGSIKQVTTDIAHDLRTPLGRLRQHLESPRLANPSVDVCVDVIDKAKNETDQILRTFDALLQIGQISALDLRRRFTDVDLSELASQLAESYQPVAAEKGQNLAAQISPGLHVQGHRELLAQMLVNMIENAINHSPSGAHINLWVGTHEGNIELILADSGPGIPAEHRKKIFQPFYRLERSRKTPGSGLGLALVRSIAKIHGIGIALEDNAPGLVFGLAFPTRKRDRSVTPIEPREIARS
ncbi:MAG TPA: HAMP domain-containing sensor histidine kinase, partial [Hyphomicrobiales bacterium]|nr:HAMP domain-containing sensor histidine kinase [Hyphomicrobiales bacterium]